MLTVVSIDLNIRVVRALMADVRSAINGSVSAAVTRDRASGVTRRRIAGLIRSLVESCSPNGVVVPARGDCLTVRLYHVGRVHKSAKYAVNAGGLACVGLLRAHARTVPNREAMDDLE
jgi:hypothetical protein